MGITSEFDAELTAEARTLIATARAFAHDVVSPAAARGGGWDRGLLRDASRLGLAGMELPRELGGAGQTFLLRIRVAEELARADFGFAFSLINHMGAALRIARNGFATAKSAYIPPLLAGDLIGCTAMSEPGHGSDFGAISCRATRRTDGWALTGDKRWIANAAGAEVMITFAQTGASGDREGIACFLVDARDPGFTRHDPEPFDSLPMGGIGGFRLDDHIVPDTGLISAPGFGFLNGLTAVNSARVHIAAMACGMIAASLDEALAWAERREAFGGIIADNQGLAWSLADVASTLAALRLLTYRAARLCERDPANAAQAAAIAKKFAAEHAAPATAACLQVLGARGIRSDCVAQRHFRAAPATGMADGTTQMMNERIAANIRRASRDSFRSKMMTDDPQTFDAIIVERDDEKAISARLTRVATADLPDGDVTVRVLYSTLNYKDALAITGASPVVKSYPMVPGIDFAGVVTDSRDPRFVEGQELILTGWGVGESHWGGLARYARVKGDWLVPLPDGMTAAQAMGVGTAGFTAMLCVDAVERHLEAINASGPVLVTGANGGVGSTAIALLAARGHTVIASTGRMEEADHLRSLGASEIIDRSELSQPGRPLQKERWVAAVDCVGSTTLANVCAGTRYNGVVAACGLAQGMDLTMTVAPFILRGVSLIGIDSVYVPTDRRPAIWERIATDLPPSFISENVTTISLDEVIDTAGELLAGRIRGRVIVDLSV